MNFRKPECHPRVQPIPPGGGSPAPRATQDQARANSESLYCPQRSPPCVFSPADRFLAGGDAFRYGGAGQQEVLPADGGHVLRSAGGEEEHPVPLRLPSPPTQRTSLLLAGVDHTNLKAFSEQADELWNLHVSEEPVAVEQQRLLEDE
jgi:hypothetical protein